MKKISCSNNYMIKTKYEEVRGKLKKNSGASVVFAIVGFMFAAMISLVVVGAAYSNAMRLKSMKRAEQMNLVAQAVSGVVTDALTGTNTATKLNIPEDNEGEKIIKQGYTLNYQYVDVTDDTGSKRYFATRSGADFSSDYLLTASALGPDTAIFVEYGKSSDAADVTEMRRMISNMAKEVLKSNDKNYEKEVTLTSTTTLAEENYTIEVKIKMNKNYELEIVSTVESHSDKYVVRMNADPVCVSQKETVKGIVDDSGATVSATGTQTFKVNDCYITWPAKQITCVTSK